ncbi:uncharacterized protein KQ657_004961 [Scheffersomyces spartinae]|uniref:Sulfhydryl oxidase n=1 Tax=Scheffersomyces spartinae TaxID=45513 RepID=A0A9P7VAY8_9ASCO|nr:uncharacterized protein KQ657_004961 [Scheffersomyces spartinae]KAG7194241.1 hypothetical protein KQ657_004961 [Scheffersomyces spartinae]
MAMVKMVRRPLATAFALAILFGTFIFMMSGLDRTIELAKDSLSTSSSSGAQVSLAATTPFMPKMANETLKAELGNASWKLFHTILARYPETPSEDEQTSLRQYIHLFAQVYPCGDCARHFIKLLKKYPPQVSGRKEAALWGCYVHNKVNEKLKKPEYDCTNILEDYDCGCGDDEKESDFTLGNELMEKKRKKTDNAKGNKMFALEKEELQKGG